MNNLEPGNPSVLKPLALVACALTIVLLLLFWAGRFPDFIETYYSTGLYHFISCIWHLLINWLPFSLGDVFYTAVILLVIWFIIRLIRHLFNKAYILLVSGILRLLISLQIFIGAFYLLWGMNYFRPPAAKLLSLQKSVYTFTQLQEVTRLLIDSANTNRSALTPAELQENNSLIYKASVAAIRQLGHRHKSFKSYYPAAKPSLFTPVINFMGTAGYFNPFSGEAQINYAMPIANRPITACHEMAHQMGFAREDEANFVGFLAGERSPDRLLRYSAYYMAMEEFMTQVYLRDTVVYHHLKATIAQPVKNDIKADRLYWEHYQNQLGYLSSLFYDRFLKMNNQPEGLRTYNRMIDLTMAYYSPLLNTPRKGGL